MFYAGVHTYILMFFDQLFEIQKLYNERLNALFVPLGIIWSFFNLITIQKLAFQPFWGVLLEHKKLLPEK